MPDKDFKFALSKANNIIVFNLSFVLLLAKVELISKEQGRKADALVVCSSGNIKIILALFTKIVALHR